MPNGKTPREILDGLDEMGEFYALPKTLNGFSDVVATNDENGLQYRAMAVNKDLHDYFRFSMRSLLEGVMEKMPDTLEQGCEHTDGKPSGCVSCKEIRAFNSAIGRCRATIQSVIDSIKE